MDNDQKPDVYSQKSERKGFGGLFENVLREFKIVGHLILLAPLYMVGSFCLGLAFIPGFYLYQWVNQFSAGCMVFQSS